MMGFGSVGVGNGGSSFSNLSPLAPPFTLDRSVSKPISTPLVDMSEPSFGGPVKSSLHNWLPPSSQTEGLDFFASEFDWLPFSGGSIYSGSQAIEPSDKHVPLLGPFSISSTDASLYGDFSETLTNSIGKAKPYYPSYASTSLNNACPLGIVDQPSYDWLSSSAFEVQSCKNYSHGSSGSERSVEEASPTIDMLGLNKCSEFVRKQPNEELLFEHTPNIMPVENLQISGMDAHSAFPGCHPKSKTPPSYQEILREQDARLGDTTVVNSPATFSNRPPAEAKWYGNNPLNVKEILPFSSESYFDMENHGTCIDKNDPIITESLSTKIQDLPNNVCTLKDTSGCVLKAEVGSHIPDVSPYSTLDLKTIETSRTVESSSESFDQYSLSVDSPCWKGALVSRMSSFEASENVIPQHVKKVETCNSKNISLSQFPHYTAVDTVKVFVHEPTESTINSSLEKGAASFPKTPSVASALPAEQNTSDSGNAGNFSLKMGRLCRAFNNIHEPVADGSDSDPSHSVAQNNQHDLTSGKKLEKNTDARLHGCNSSEDGLNHLSCGAAKNIQHFPSCTEDRPSKLTKADYEESKIDIRLVVDAMHNLSELLRTYRSSGLGVLHQRDVKSLQIVISNLDMCIINSVGPQDSLSPKQRTSQKLGQFDQLHRDVGVPKSQVTNIEGENVYPLCDWHSPEENNQNIFSVKKDSRAADLRNDINLTKEDDMTLALKKVLSENFPDEGENPQSLMYKNLWLDAEAALCAFNFRSRFNRAKLEMEKHATPRVGENAKNQDDQPLSDASPRPSTIEKLASDTKVGPTPLISIQTSPAVSTSSHADDVITRFHILKCRDDETKPRIVENSEELTGSKVSIEVDMVEESTPNTKTTAVSDIKDMDSPFPTAKVMENDFGAGIARASPIFTKCSPTDDVMSRFQILKSRDEQMKAKVQKISSSNCSEADLLDGTFGPCTSVKYPPNADNRNEVDNLDASVTARLNVLRNRGNSISSSLGEGQLPEAAFQYSGGNRRGHWPMVENKVKGGVLGVEIEPFLQVGAEDSLSGKDYGSHVEDKFPASYFDETSSDWEHVLLGE